MTGLAAFDAFCGTLPGSRMVVQWGGAHVHKVGPKVYAIGGGFSGVSSYIFKATPLCYQLLLEQGIGTRAPYLPRGRWVRVEGKALKKADLFGYIEESHGLVAAMLTRAVRAELGIG